MVRWSRGTQDWQCRKGNVASGEQNKKRLEETEWESETFEKEKKKRWLPKCTVFSESGLVSAVMEV